MKYTKAQRHKIYKKALERFSSFGESFLCHAIQSALNIPWEYHDTILKDFPEIWRHRPKHKSGSVWFGQADSGKRITILHTAIRQTKTKTE